MFEDAVRYPTSGDDAVSTLIVGGLLHVAAGVILLVGALLTLVIVGIFVLPFAVVPYLLVTGYSVRVIQRVFAGDEEPPRFIDWGELLADGFKVFVAGFVYSLPLLALGIVAAIVIAVAAAVVGDATGGFFAASTALLFGGLGVIYGLVVSYVFPAAIVNVAVEDRLGAAFSLETIGRIALDGEYFVAWLLAFVVLVVGNAVAGSIPILGLFLVFWVQVVVTFLYARGARAALEIPKPGDDRHLDEFTTVDPTAFGEPLEDADGDADGDEAGVDTADGDADGDDVDVDTADDDSGGDDASKDAKDGEA